MPQEATTPEVALREVAPNARITTTGVDGDAGAGRPATEDPAGRAQRPSTAAPHDGPRRSRGQSSRDRRTSTTPRQPDGVDMLEPALRWAAEWKLPVVPLHVPIWTDDRVLCSCRQERCVAGGHQGKHPHGTAQRLGLGLDDIPPGESGYKLATLDADVIRRTWMARPYCNVGVAAGPTADLFVIEVDPRNGGDESLRKLTSKGIEIVPTAENVSGGGGRHIFYRFPRDENGEPLVGLKSRFELPGYPGVEFLGGAVGSGVAVPPSIHRSGRRYDFREGHRIGVDTDIASMAPSLIRFIAEHGRHSRSGTDAPRGELAKAAGDLVAGVRPGNRVETLKRIVLHLLRMGASEAEVATVAEAWNDGLEFPLPEAELSAQVEGLCRWFSETGDRLLDLPTSDIGYADRIALLHGDDCLWCETANVWYVWDDRRWTLDEVRRVHGYAEGVARETSRRVASLPSDDPRRGELLKRAAGRESAPRIEASVTLFKNRVAVPPTEFDRDPWAFNVLNGTIDLRTGLLRGHDRRDRITKLAPVEYDPEAECPGWLRFLDRIFAGDAELISYVQRLCGMSLAGEVRDHAFIILQGPGHNGKTQFVRAINAIMGDYAVKVRPETLTASRSSASSHSEGIARLAGARFACADETEDGDQLAESLIKRLTGGDIVRARDMYKSSFEFEPQFTLWLDTNHRPSIPRGGAAIWRRLKLVPFVVTVPEAERVPHIGLKLAEREGPGILRWAVEGCLAWLTDGLGTAEAVERATGEYRADEDKVASFLAERTVRDPGGRVGSGELYVAFRDWCEANGVQPISHKRFTRRLRDDHGIGGDRDGTGRWYVGIVRSEPSPGTREA